MQKNINGSLLSFNDSVYREATTYLSTLHQVRLRGQPKDLLESVLC